MSNTTAIAAILMAATLAVGGSIAAIATTTPSVAFAYQKKGVGQDSSSSKNGNTVTIQKCKQAATQSGFDTSFEEECQNLICTHPNDNATCSQEGVTSLQTANLVVCKVVKDFNTGHILDPESAFTLQVTGNNPSPSSFPGSAPPTCTTITLGPGGFQVREVGAGPLGADSEFCIAAGLGKDVIIDRAHLHNEYCVNFSQGCSGTIAAGETKTCTVTNSAADIG